MAIRPPVRTRSAGRSVGIGPPRGACGSRSLAPARAAGPCHRACRDGPWTPGDAEVASRPWRRCTSSTPATPTIASAAASRSSATATRSSSPIPGWSRAARGSSTRWRALDVAPEAVTHVFLSHHHPDHTVNIALFPNAEVVDFWARYRDDLWLDHDGDGYRLSPECRALADAGPHQRGRVADRHGRGRDLRADPPVVARGPDARDRSARRRPGRHRGRPRARPSGRPTSSSPATGARSATRADGRPRRWSGSADRAHGAVDGIVGLGPRRARSLAQPDERDHGADHEQDRRCAHREVEGVHRCRASPR